MKKHSKFIDCRYQPNNQISHQTLASYSANTPVQKFASTADDVPHTISDTTLILNSVNLTFEGTTVAMEILKLRSSVLCSGLKFRRNFIKILHIFQNWEWERDRNWGI
jgi:hypothetical protein